MSINLSVFLIKPYYFIRRYTTIFLLLIGGISFYSSTYAESCWISQETLGLGTANSQGSITASTTLKINCNSNYDKPVAYKICLVVDSTDPNSYDPRSMISYDTYPAPLLHYNLYYDVAKTQKIPNTNNQTNAKCQSFQVSANSGNPGTTIVIYGQIIPGQNVPAGFYRTNTATLKLLYNYRYGIELPSDSTVLANPITATNYLLVNSTYENSCLILSASDIDFGSVEAINNSLTRSGTIQLACPTGTNMKVSLDNGNNALGSQRRMRNQSGNYIQYNLSQDIGGNIAWTGNTVYSFSTPSIPVYATVLPQKIEGIGQYSDTVTITLTY